MSVFGVFLVQKTDQKNSEYGTFHAVCILSIKLHLPKDWATSKHKRKQQQKKKEKKNAEYMWAILFVQLSKKISI